MQLVVLAGGFGTRLRGAIPDELPKPMAPIAGKPFLERFFDQAITQGVTSIHLLLGYAADIISSHFGTVYCGLPVTYSFEDLPLGTGGALRAASSQLADEFIFANGDTFADVSYVDLLGLLEQSCLSMSVAAVEDVDRYGSVITEKGIVVGFSEKGLGGAGFVNAGVYACRRSLLDLLPQRHSFSFEVDFLEPKLELLRPPYQIVETGILDIGTPESYAIADVLFGGKPASQSGR